MAKIQVFFDYECPHCKRGFEYFTAQIHNMSDLEIELIPIESHPLPENHFPNTNLACQSYYIAKELGADMESYHAAMFKAASTDRQDVSKIDVLCAVLKGIVDSAKLRSMLSSGKYAKQIDENNDLAYEKSGVWYVPAFRMNDKKLDAKGGIGVTPDELKEFLGK